MSDEDFTEIVRSCRTLTQLWVALGQGVKPNGQAAYGRGWTAIRNRVISLGLIDHFKDTHHTKRDSYLKEMSELKERASVRARIIRDNLLEYKCSVKECGNTGFWLGKVLALHLDHKDGNNKNHDISNLRWLCPNCHRQTDTYGGRNSRKSNRMPRPDSNQSSPGPTPDVLPLNDGAIT